MSPLTGKKLGRVIAVVIILQAAWWVILFGIIAAILLHFNII